LLSNMTPLEKATHAQRMAADPSGTRLAAANAGSGKTRVLVDRVSRILLGGTEPEDILCLTYTKAAASEMQERLFATLKLSMHFANVSCRAFRLRQGYCPALNR